LPTQLVAAFRATLEEVLDADLILHIRDITHPETEEQAADVREILETLGISDKAQASMIEVWNKIDLADTAEKTSLQAIAARNDTLYAASAISGEGIDPLLEAVDAALQDRQSTEILHLGFDQGKQRAWLFAQNVVDHEDQTEDGFDIKVIWTARQANSYRTL
jgi:GTPase